MWDIGFAIAWGAFRYNGAGLEQGGRNDWLFAIVKNRMDRLRGSRGDYVYKNILWNIGVGWPQKVISISNSIMSFDFERLGFIEMLSRTGPSSKPVLFSWNWQSLHGQQVSLGTTTFCIWWINNEITKRWADICNLSWFQVCHDNQNY